jgi:NifU-like protein involved in Fe-S cluster formation
MKEDPLHREIVEEHAIRPHYNQKLVHFSHENSFTSQKTGNLCDIQLLVQDGVIEGISCQMQASALATACGSLMACHVHGHAVADAKVLVSQVIDYLEGKTDQALPGELAVYESIRLFRERHDCALLGWHALEKACVTEI